jgi:FkbM family methyltransferase
MSGRWAAADVVPALVADARGWADKAWVILYFVARQQVFGRRPFSWLAPAPRALRWRSVSTPLAVSVASGGLSVWYEIAHRNSYAPTDAFRPRPGWTVVDVGANIGAYSVWAGSSMGSDGLIVAIEPNPVSQERLRTSLSGLTVSHTAIAEACGAVAGEVTLHFEPGYTVSSSVVPFAEASNHVQVTMRPLDEILREQGVGQIDMLKIDVEGAEEDVLAGASDALTRAARVILETTEATEPGVRAVLADHGFSLVHEEVEHWSVVGLKLLAFERDRRQYR